MPKINMTKVFKSFYGDSDLLSATPKEDGTPQSLTMREVCIEALLSTYPDEAQLTGQEKFARYKLARSLEENLATVEDTPLTQVSSEDVVLLKGLIAKKYVPLVIGQAFEILEQE